jgi:hypothetical protein
MSNLQAKKRLSFNQIVDAVHQLKSTELQKLSSVLRDLQTPIPIEHQRISIDRIEKSKLNPERLLDWDEVSKDF